MNSSLPSKTTDADAQAEIEELRRRLQEAEETIEAIRTGAVDALVVTEPGGHRIYTLEGAERPYRLFVEEMQQGAATLHTDGTIAWCNLQFAKLIKLPQEKLIGLPLSDFIAPANNAAYEESPNECHDYPSGGETYLRSVDGERVPVFLTCNALPRDCGAAMGVLVTDLTTQRHHDELAAAHEALGRAERELREFLENASVAMHWVGPDGVILWANQTELNLLGYTSEEYVGHNIAEFHADAPVIESILGRLTKGETLRDCEARLRSKDGSIRHVLIDSNALFENNTFVHSRCFTRDITERKQAVDALRESEERYRTLFATIDEGFCVIEFFDGPHGPLSDYIHVAANPAYERHAGIPNVVGQKVREMVPDEADGWIELYRNVLVTGHPIRFERELIATKRHLELSAFRVEPESRRQVAVIFQDVTDRKRAEEAMRESEERFRMVADNIPPLAWTCDQLGNVTWYNQRWLDYTGMTFDDMKAWGWKKVHHPDHIERVIARVQRSAETGELWEDTFPLRGKDGEYRWFLSRAVPIRDEKGNVVRWFGTNTDVTDVREAQAKLAEAHAQLASRAEHLETLVRQRTAKLTETIGELETYSYSIVHDMRAPLRSMQGFSRILRHEFGEKLGPEGAGYLDRIGNSAERMDRLIQDVLTFSRITRSELRLEPVNTDTLVRELVDTYSNLRAEKENIHIEGTLPTVAGNAAALTQSFSNLLGNAVKFIAPGSRPNIRVWAESKEGRTKIFVKDKGIGIPEQSQTRIFELFQRASIGYEGTGIGLPIVKKSIERMGGSVGVESQPGHGSTFWLELKLA